jgi:hypothetical protein
MLTMATLSESATLLESQERASSMLGNMVHGTVTSIRGVNSANLWAAISDDYATLQSLRFQLVRNGERDERAERQLIDAARVVRLGEETAAAMVSLAEIAIYEGEIPRKHRSDSAVMAADLLMEAFTMVNALARQRDQELAEVKMPAPGSLPLYVLPVGYIDYRVVRGLFLELLKNCALHSSRDEQGVVPVTVAMRLVTNGEAKRLVVTITSPTIDKNWRREDGIAVPDRGQRRKSFLLRLTEFGRRAKWLSVTSCATNDGSEWRYVTELCLDRVSVHEGAEAKMISPLEGDEVMR